MPGSALAKSVTGRPRSASVPAEAVGVLDIGSNSLRLVLYDRLSRAPSVLLNEKVMCALGRGLNATGKLNPAGVVLARDHIERFVLLSRRLGVTRLDIIATSAVRDAEDGPEFVREIEARCDVTVTVIDGLREGRLAALGVRAGIGDAEGLCGDLGGGSLELAMTGAQPSAEVVSLPIGPLRLLEESGDEWGPRQAIDSAIGGLDWLGQGAGKPFYAVGGSWRALARIHMEQTRYPLHIIQNYVLSAAEAEGFLELIDRQSRRSLEKMIGISRRRLEMMPLAAHALRRLLAVIRPSSLVFSVYGLREGHLFDQLGRQQRAEDPLLSAARQMARSLTRFGIDDKELYDWTEGLLEAETAAEARLRRAASLLSDIGWNEHPDYRAEQTFTRCLRMPAPGLDHPGRVFIATVLYARYGGDIDAPWVSHVRPLLDDVSFGRARSLGMAFRLAYTISGGAPDVLNETRLIAGAGDLVLSVPERNALFSGEAVQRRLDAVGRAMGLRTSIRAGP